MRDEDLVDHWRSITSGVRWTEQRVGQILEDSGVSAQWFVVLHSLLHAEGQRSPMSVLAREVSMTSGGFTKLADRMAREGLIDRRSSANDRRVVHAALTADGLVMAEKAAVTMGALADAHAARVQDEEPSEVFVTEVAGERPDRRRGNARE